MSPLVQGAHWDVRMNLNVIMRVTWSNCDEKNDIERCSTYIEQSHYCRALIQDQYMNKKLMYTGLISSRRCSRKKKKVAP